MITEDYCNFDIAKLLKEKGFDWCESPFYSEQDRDEWRQNNSYTIPNMEYNPDIPFDSEALTMVAPHVSIQMAMKWLREVHKIFIDVDFDTIEFGDEPYYTIITDMSTCSYITGRPALGYKTYEEAAEAAIKFCLENLI